MRRLGDIMHDVEDVISEYYIGREEAAILDAYSILSRRFKKNKEEYCDADLSPGIIFRGYRKSCRSSSKPAALKKLHKVIRELSVDHDCQWNEILGLIHAYIKSHTINLNYFYEYGPHTNKNVSKVDKVRKSG